MRVTSAMIVFFIACAPFAVPASAMVGGGGMHSGPYNSSAMAVMRERQERVRKCSALRGFDSTTMTFVRPNGRRQKCA